MLMREDAAQVQAMIDISVAKLKAELAVPKAKAPVKEVEKKIEKDAPAKTVVSKGGK